MGFSRSKTVPTGMNPPPPNSGLLQDDPDRSEWIAPARACRWQPTERDQDRHRCPCERDPRSLVPGRNMDCLLAGDFDRRGHLHHAKGRHQLAPGYRYARPGRGIRRVGCTCSVGLGRAVDQSERMIQACPPRQARCDWRRHSYQLFERCARMSAHPGACSPNVEQLMSVSIGYPWPAPT